MNRNVAIAAGVVVGLILAWVFLRRKSTPATVGAGSSAATVSLGDSFDVNGMVHATPLPLLSPEPVQGGGPLGFTGGIK